MTLGKRLLKILAAGTLLLAAVPVLEGAELKPRLVVLTDIAPNDVEPDDMESMIRLMVHADLFEIEGLISTTGWSSGGGTADWIRFIYDAIDAYEQDLPNLRKRSEQEGHLVDESRQEIGYWPSPDYLRSRTMLGSQTRGMRFIGEENHSAGSDWIVQLADEADDRPLWVTVWGGGNTLAQSIWQVQQTRDSEALKRFLNKLRVYTITDQDQPWQERTTYINSSHQWMRREFESELRFLWDESAWNFQNETGKANWDAYGSHIQGHGHLGALYPKFKWGVEGDTPSFLYILPNGLNDPEHPGYGGWGGYFMWATGPDGTTHAYVNHRETPAYPVSQKYQTRFYPAIFNNFAARMDWAHSGRGNRNPELVLNGEPGQGAIRNAAIPGANVVIDASNSSDPDGDELNYHWWVLPEAGTYSGEIEITDSDSSVARLRIPTDAAGKTFHVICEVVDNGSPRLTSYRRVIFSPPASSP